MKSGSEYGIGRVHVKVDNHWMTTNIIGPALSNSNSSTLALSPSDTRRLIFLHMFSHYQTRPNYPKNLFYMLV